MNNEPAFPTASYAGHGDFVHVGGMTLRDFFAAKAMQGLIANGNNQQLNQMEVARYAYSRADAMLKEREK